MLPAEIRKSIGVYLFHEVHEANLPLLDIGINENGQYIRRFGCAIIALANALYALGGIAKEEFSEKLIEFSLELNDDPHVHGVPSGLCFDFIGQSEDFKKYDRAMLNANALNAEIVLRMLTLGGVLLVVEKWFDYTDEWHLNTIHFKDGKFYSSGIEMIYEDLMSRVFMNEKNIVFLLADPKIEIFKKLNLKES